MWRVLGAGIVAAGTAAPADAVVRQVGSYAFDDAFVVNGLATGTGSYGTSARSFPVFDGFGNTWRDVFGGTSGSGPLSFLTPTGGAPSQPSSGNANVSIEASFAQPVANSPGDYDIYAFEVGDGPPQGSATDPGNPELEGLSASLDGSGGSFVDFDVLSFVPDEDLGAGGTDDGIYIYGLDLADLGVGTGATLSSLFIGNANAFSDWDPDVIYMSGGTLGEVPLPGSLGLLLAGIGGLGGLAALRRRRAPAG